MNGTPPATELPDADRDAWLGEALRHAPDAAIAPPAALSAAILREAHAKARRAAAVPPRQPGLGTRLWVWLAQPVVGAGLASVMVGTVIVLMWWDRPLQDDAPRMAPAPVVVAEAPAPAAPPAVIAPSPREAADASKAPPAMQRRRDPQPPREASVKPRAGVNGSVEAKLSVEANPSVPPERASAGDATLEAAASAGPATQAMAPAAPSGLSTPAAAARPMARSAAADPSAKRLADTADSRGRADSGSAERALLSLRAALKSEAVRWTWQHGSAAPAPVDERLRAWLAQLDAATATRWTRGPSAVTEAADAGDTSTLRLLRDGQVAHALQLEQDGVRWQRSGPANAVLVWQAPLDEAPMEALRRSLPGIVR